MEFDYVFYPVLSPPPIFNVYLVNYESRLLAAFNLLYTGSGLQSTKIIPPTLFLESSVTRLSFFACVFWREPEPEKLPQSTSTVILYG